MNDQESSPLAFLRLGDIEFLGTCLAVQALDDVAGVGTIQNGFDLIVAAPLLGPLQNNGGPTPTIELLANDPSLDNGDDLADGLGVPATDQRGVPRGDVWNLGAYQASASQLSISGLPALTTAGTPVGFSVTALDSFGKTAFGYDNTVTIAASAAASLPPATEVNVAGTFLATPETAGVETLVATDGQFSASQAIVVVPGAAANLVPTGSGQSTMVGNGFSVPLQVLVTDAFNNPVSGVSVVFAAPNSGASGVFAGTTAETAVNGIAIAPALTANQVAGTFTVTAALGTLQASFQLTNRPGPPATTSITAPLTVTPANPTFGHGRNRPRCGGGSSAESSARPG